MTGPNITAGLTPDAAQKLQVMMQNPIVQSFLPILKYPVPVVDRLALVAGTLRPLYESQVAPVLNPVLVEMLVREVHAEPEFKLTLQAITDRAAITEVVNDLKALSREEIAAHV